MVGMVIPRLLRRASETLVHITSLLQAKKVDPDAGGGQDKSRGAEEAIICQAG